MIKKKFSLFSQNIAHNPGSYSEESKEEMHNAYLQTKELYSQTFGYEWPEEIWEESSYDISESGWFNVNLLGLVKLINNLF